jgi:hypothetical protein
MIVMKNIYLVLFLLLFSYGKFLEMKQLAKTLPKRAILLEPDMMKYSSWNEYGNDTTLKRTSIIRILMVRTFGNEIDTPLIGIAL